MDAALPLEITCQEVRDKVAASEDLLLIDCREREEYEIVNIDGAALVPMSEIAGRLAELADSKDRHIVVYCHLGARSAQVATWLRDNGFAHVQSLAGGIDRWTIEIQPHLPRY